MPNQTPFFPELRALMGRPKRSEAAKMSDFHKKMQQSSSSQWQSIFTSVFPPELFEGFDQRKRTFTAQTTFYSMIHQALNNGRNALRDCLRHIQSIRHINKAAPISSATGGLSTARKRLSLPLMNNLFERSVAQLDRLSPQIEGFEGRQIKLIDGTGISTEDTPANQFEFPQSSQCARGCGFPLVQMVGLFSLNHGGLLHGAVTQMPENELVVFDSEISEHLCEGDILVGDCAYYSYWNMAKLTDMKVDAVIAMPRKTVACAEVVQEYGKGDRLLRIKKPRQHSEHLSDEFYRALPQTQIIRVIDVWIRDQNNNRKLISIATTLKDAKKYPKTRIVKLYLRRWKVEVSYLDMKTSLPMTHLAAKSPHMVERLLRAYWIAYNIIRLLMLEASLSYGVALERISFRGSLSTVIAFAPHLHQVRFHPQKHKKMRDYLLAIIASDKLPRRPGRMEPRKTKRRQQKYPFLTQHRDIERQQLQGAFWGLN